MIKFVNVNVSFVILLCRQNSQIRTLFKGNHTHSVLPCFMCSETVISPIEMRINSLDFWCFEYHVVEKTEFALTSVFDGGVVVAELCNIF